MSERRLLNSWKEIASYLGRGVRTVQRWESQMGLPVHRPAGKDHSAVLAFSSELDEWLNRDAVRNSSALPTHLAFDPAPMQSLLAQADHLLQRCETLILRNEDVSRKLSIIAESLGRKTEVDTEKSSRRSEAGAA
jgi:hypothetical protein